MRITILAGPGDSTTILRNYLADNGFGDVETIIEQAVSRWSILAYRHRKLGFIHAAGQAVFMAGVLPILKLEARRRRRELLQQYGMRLEAPSDTAVRVPNINDQFVVERLRQRAPEAVIVNGTRILKRPILGAISCPIINTHVGITPAYRGVHGGYWALWQCDSENFGTTLHLVDDGVDTGAALRRIRARVTARDNFVTYPIIQQAVSLPALLDVLDCVRSRTLTICSGAPVTESRQWYHPTAIQYVMGRLRGVK